MILVTVGTHSQGFDRLVRAMDEVAAELNERVAIQRGSGTYEPLHAEHFRFTSAAELERLTQEARIIVAHAAAGTILLALQHNKPLVLVPRLQRFGEHLDDHQLQLAAALADEGKAVAVHEVSPIALRPALDQAMAQKRINQGAGRLVAALRHQLAQWAL